MKRNLRGFSSYILVCIFLLFIMTPSISRGVFLWTGVDAFLFSPEQNETTWEILEHDYISEDIRQRDIEFVNATHGWVLSQKESGTRHGMILHTNDSGDSWYQQLYNASQRFEQIEVIDSETLWVTGVGGAYHTQNGGLFWNKTNIGDPDEFFFGIHFYNKTHGWITSANLYTTTDGGQTWISVESWTFDDDGGRLIYFINPLDGWIIGFLGIYHTTDGGETWEKEVDHGGWTISFVSESEAWAVADNWLAHMTDGETWMEQELPRTSLLPSSPPYFSDILFLDTNNGWIVGDETEVAYTPNGGNDWFSQPFPHDNRVSAVDFINVTHGWAVGRDGYIYRTTKGNSLGISLWTGFFDSGIIWTVSVLVLVVITISGSLVIRKRREKSMSIQKGAELM